MWKLRWSTVECNKEEEESLLGGGGNLQLSGVREELKQKRAYEKASGVSGKGASEGGESLKKKK